MASDDNFWIYLFNIWSISFVFDADQDTQAEKDDLGTFSLRHQKKEEAFNLQQWPNGKNCF